MYFSGLAAIYGAVGGQFNGFTVLGLSPDGTNLILKSSGAIAAGLASSSGSIHIEPSAFYQNRVADPTALVSTFVSVSTKPNETVTISGAAGLTSGLTRLVRLTLTNATWKTSFTSGMFTASSANANAVAIISGVAAGNIQRISDTELLITAASGLTAGGYTGLTVGSGAFLQGSGVPTIDLSASYRAEIANKGAVTITNAGGRTFTIDITGAEFKTVLEGLNVSDIVITGSGSTTVASGEQFSPKQKADSVASLLTFALQNGDYTRSDVNTIVITVPVGQTVAANSLVVSIKPNALIEGQIDTTAIAVTLKQTT